MSDVYPGMYRGVVVATDDPQERSRVRVRIDGIDDSSIPPSACPWAELGGIFATRDAVDVPHYEIDDRVWVIFEHGRRDMPIIFGGILTNSGGIPDLPLENVGDYPETRKRWRRQDRYGNFLELSEVTNERHVKIGSGSASVTVTQRGNRIKIEADGPVEVKATSVNVDADKVTVDGGDISIEATGTFFGTPIPWGVAQLLSNSEVVIGVPMLSNPLGSVKIGQHLDTLLIPRQTFTVDILPSIVNIGKSAPLLGIPTITASIDAALMVSVGSLTTALTSIGGVTIWMGGIATAVIDISATGSVSLSTIDQTTRVSLVPGAVLINSTGTIQVISGGNASVLCGGTAEVTVGGAATIAVGGVVTLSSGGACSISSGGTLSLVAPVVNVGGAMTINGIPFAAHIHTAPGGLSPAPTSPPFVP